jgi:hypothetical protein
MLWSCGWKELEGGGMWAANRASELVVLARQPWGRRQRVACTGGKRWGFKALAARGGSNRSRPIVGKSRYSKDRERRAAARMPNGAKRCGRPTRAGMARGTDQAHPRQAQEPERSARTDGHRSVSVCARIVAEPAGRGRSDVVRGVHVPARDIST